MNNTSKACSIRIQPMRETKKKIQRENSALQHPFAVFGHENLEWGTANPAPQPPTVLKPWQRGGPTPNPLGRKRGTPNKFSRAFLADVADKWQAHGGSVLEEVRREDPATFLRVCASL